MQTSARCDGFSIVGIDIVKQDDEAWRASLGTALQSFTKDKTAEAYTPEIDSAAWNWVKDRLHYMSGDFKDPGTFDRLRQTLKEGSAIFYLAVAARFFSTVVEGLGKAQLFHEDDGKFRPGRSDQISARNANQRPCRILQ